jgi:membrane protein YdbS with pleckstrin-like domain
MFEAVWLFWEAIALVALIGAVSMTLLAVWAIYRWHDVWRYEEEPEIIHEEAHLWPKEQR